MDLVLYHHNHTKSNYPDLCSILKKADHHSASEREDIDDTQEVNKTPLISLFSKIVLEGNDKVDEQYIPLNKLSLDDGSFNNLKPAAKKDTMGGWNLVPEYNRLWDEFNSEFELIQNKTDFNTLLALLKKYASTMPSAAYKSKSDISLYDHSKTTAALAVSRYLFNRDGDVKLTQNNDLNCYLAIEGDISGIQKFIFKISSPQEAQSGMSKRLRGRSLYLTLLCDAIATHIAEELELCEANILFCGGGRFTIIGPNTQIAKEKLAEIKSKLNKFFIDEFNAELYLALVSIECCGDDLAKFGQITRKLSNKLNEDKKHKFSDNLDDVFNFDEEIKYDDLCSVCGTPYPKKEDSVVCKTCKNHEKLGQNAANADYMIKCITDKGEGYFIEPANVDYHFLNKSRDIADKINSWSKTCKKVEVIKLNDTNFLDLANHEFESNVSFSFSFMGNTVPNLGRFADNHKYMPLYFEHLAKISNGANKLGVLKMDVDNLGLIFSEGLKESYDENLGISRVSALSSQLDMFFSGFVNNIASEFKVYSKVFDEDKFDKKELEIQNDNEEIKESVFVYKLKYGCELSDDEADKLKDYEIPTIHINYSGGDDLLVLGPYDDIIKFAQELRNTFKIWTASNPSINLSGGINIVSPKFPIGKAAITSEEYLDAAKSCGRDKITLFGEVVNWDTKDLFKGFDELFDFAVKLEDYCTNNRLSKGIVYSMLHLWQNNYKNLGLLSNENKWDEDVHRRLSIKRFVPLFKYKLRLVKDKEVFEDLNKKGLKFMPWIKIPVNQEINKNLEEQLLRIFDSWFLKFELSNEFSDSKLGLIPKGWKIDYLGSKKSCSIIKSGIDEFDNSKIYIATADVDNSIITSNDTLITMDDKPSRANMQPISNSIWFAKMIDSKKLIMVDEYCNDLLNNYIFSTGFCGLKCVDKYFYYLWTFLLTDVFDVMKNNFCTGTTMQAINNKDTKLIEFVLPDDKTITQFNSIAKPMFKKIYYNNLEIKKLQRLRDALLPKLMSGEIDVSKINCDLELKYNYMKYLFNQIHTPMSKSVV